MFLKEKKIIMARTIGIQFKNLIYTRENKFSIKAD